MYIKNKIERFRILTDCLSLQSEYKYKLITFEKCEDVIWIPRELNSIKADSTNEGRNTNKEIYTKYKLKIESKNLIILKLKTMI